MDERVFETLDWDEYNTAHAGRHGLTPEIAMSVLVGSPRRVSRAADYGLAKHGKGETTTPRGLEGTKPSGKEAEEERMNKEQTEELTEEQRRDREIAEFYESRKGDVEGLVPVKARVSKTPRTVFSLRLDAKELMELLGAAKQRDVTVSAFIRDAATAEARRQRLDGAEDNEAVIEELTGQLGEMNKSLKRLVLMARNRSTASRGARNEAPKRRTRTPASG